MAHKTKIGSRVKREHESPLDHARAFEVVWPQVEKFFSAVRGISPISFVYVIGEESEGPVKIGIAKDPIKRLRAMQTGNPRRLRVEFVVLGDNHTEKLLHEFWEPLAITSAASRGKVDVPPGTEWFEPEIRDQLTPIMLDAQENQIDFLAEFMAAGEQRPLGYHELERGLRDAHYENGFVPKPHDEVRTLGAVAGYHIERRSRI